MFIFSHSVMVTSQCTLTLVGLYLKCGLVLQSHGENVGPDSRALNQLLVDKYHSAI